MDLLRLITKPPTLLDDIADLYERMRLIQQRAEFVWQTDERLERLKREALDRWASDATGNL